MAIKKKPKLYTNTGKVKKPVAPKKLTTEYAEAMLKSARLPSQENAIIKALKADLTEAYDAIEEMRGMYEKTLDAVGKDLGIQASKRTMSLLFGWSLVGPSRCPESKK